jgi:hypothetical protein
MNTKILLATGTLVVSGLTVVTSTTLTPSTYAYGPQVCGTPTPAGSTFDIDTYIAARKAALSAQRAQRP